MRRGRHFTSRAASNRQSDLVGPKVKFVEIDCHAVRRELVDYMEGDLTEELRARIEQHLGKCDHCTAVYDGVQNVVRLLGDKNAIDLPLGFSRRLYARIMGRAR
jgi:anti-sigma factor (TIGR02949 family)